MNMFMHERYCLETGFLPFTLLKTIVPVAANAARMEHAAATLGSLYVQVKRDCLQPLLTMFPTRDMTRTLWMCLRCLLVSQCCPPRSPPRPLSTKHMCSATRTDLNVRQPHLARLSKHRCLSGRGPCRPPHMENGKGEKRHR